MGRSVTDICNMALGRIGVSRFIADINEQSNEARICRVFYEPTRDRVLSDFDWNFATAYAALQDVGTPAHGWLFRYRYPSDCLKARAVVETANNTGIEGQSVPFRVVSDEPSGEVAICCNIETPTLIYTKRITTTTLFPWPFVTALAWALATELVMPMAVQPSLMSTAANAYMAALNQAMATNLNESEPQVQPDSEFLTVRR